LIVSRQGNLAPLSTLYDFLYKIRKGSNESELF
jgi:hypothetical protein